MKIQHFIQSIVLLILLSFVISCSKNPSPRNQNNTSQQTDTQQEKTAPKNTSNSHQNQNGSSSKSQPETDSRKTLPKFELKTIEGITITREKLKGDVVLINFWATWCGPCKVEVPYFQSFQERWKDRGFRVVGLTVQDSKENVRKFRDEYDISYPMGMASKELLEKFNASVAPIQVVPTTLIVDRSGTVQWIKRGAAQKEVFIQRIKPLLTKTNEKTE